jgi:hypothetical protein
LTPIFAYDGLIFSNFAGSDAAAIYNVYGTMRAKLASDPVATEACQAGDSYTFR